MSEDLSARVRRSILALQGRQALIMAMNLLVGIILARKLDPAVFGLYGIATFCLSLVTMATDFGMGASLVQRKEDFGRHEVSVAFTLQSIVAIAASILIWLLAPLSLALYKEAPRELVWIIRSMVGPIILSPIITIVRIQLEREIQFQKLATIEVISIVFGNAVVLGMAFLDYGVWSFVVGNLSGTLLAVVLSIGMARYMPRIVFDSKLSREMLSFGMFFQFETLTNAAAGWIIPLVSGVRLGPAAVGFLTWASSNGRRPLMVVESVMKVAFPHFSRLQDDPVELSRQVGLYFRRLLTLCYAWAFLAFMLGEPMTRIVYTEKWLPGLIPLQLFATGLVFDVANWVGGMTLTAVGGVRRTARWTLIKSTLAIAGALLLVEPLGMSGIPLASIVASIVSGVGIMIDLRRRISLPWSLLWSPAAPFALAAALYLPIHILAPESAQWLRWLFAAGASSWVAWKMRVEFKRPSPDRPATEVLD